jgi:hypothetical protein
MKRIEPHKATPPAAKAKTGTLTNDLGKQIGPIVLELPLPGPKPVDSMDLSTLIQLHRGIPGKKVVVDGYMTYVYERADNPSIMISTSNADGTLPMGLDYAVDAGMAKAANLVRMNNGRRNFPVRVSGTVERSDANRAVRYMLVIDEINLLKPDGLPAWTVKRTEAHKPPAAGDPGIAPAKPRAVSPEQDAFRKERADGIHKSLRASGAQKRIAGSGSFQYIIEFDRAERISPLGVEDDKAFCRWVVNVPPGEEQIQGFEMVSLCTFTSTLGILDRKTGQQPVCWSVTCSPLTYDEKRGVVVYYITRCQRWIPENNNYTGDERFNALPKDIMLNLYTAAMTDIAVPGVPKPQTTPNATPKTTPASLNSSPGLTPEKELQAAETVKADKPASPWPWIIVAVLATLLVSGGAFVVYVQMKAKQEREARHRRQRKHSQRRRDYHDDEEYDD